MFHSNPLHSIVQIVTIYLAFILLVSRCFVNLLLFLPNCNKWLTGWLTGIWYLDTFGTTKFVYTNNWDDKTAIKNNASFFARIYRPICVCVKYYVCARVCMSVSYFFRFVVVVIEMQPFLGIQLQLQFTSHVQTTTTTSTTTTSLKTPQQ